MEKYEHLPKQEEMKQRFKQWCGWYDDINYFKSKKHRRFMDFNWYLEAGRKPSSHNWGRKPAWRMKRREQRREKRKEQNEISQIREAELWAMQHGGRMAEGE